MGLTWGPPGADRAQLGPCRPHELCSLGGYVKHCGDTGVMAYGITDSFFVYFQGTRNINATYHWRFVRGIHQWVPPKWPVMWKEFAYHDIITKDMHKMISKYCVFCHNLIYVLFHWTEPLNKIIFIRKSHRGSPYLSHLKRIFTRSWLCNSFFEFTMISCNSHEINISNGYAGPQIIISNTENYFVQTTIFTFFIVYSYYSLFDPIKWYWPGGRRALISVIHYLC